MKFYGGMIVLSHLTVEHCNIIIEWTKVTFLRLASFVSLEYTETLIGTLI